MNFFSAALIGWLVLGSAVLSATAAIYVSSSTGSDLNDGSFIAPLKSLTAANDAVRSKHQSILLLRGDEWLDEALILNQSSLETAITIGDYGNTSLPRPAIFRQRLITAAATAPCIFYTNASNVLIQNIRFVG
jgi:hypothetical protein